MGCFFASQEPKTSICPSTRTMWPLFIEDSKFVAMIMHAMRLIKQSIDFLNPGQIPAVALDQPLYATAKKVQWIWPDEFRKIILLWFLADYTLKWLLCQ